MTKENVLIMDKIHKASEYIKSRTAHRPKLGLILGSGLGAYGDNLKNPQFIPYHEIPGFPVSTVVGHKGRFVINEQVICMQGRFHYYEGYSMEEVTFPIRVMKSLGVESIVVTNAAGGVNMEFGEGNLMLITDHINFMGQNPLQGENLEEFGPRFPDMSSVYDAEYRSIALEAAKEMKIDLRTGVYMGFSGPSFETPAEIRMAAILGADAVGMSTVPEVIVARHCSMRILGISCITNMAAGILDRQLSHAEVIETTNRIQGEFILLIEKIVEKLERRID